MNQYLYRIMKIGTHNGTFHCDEVLACFLLKQLPKYRNAEIIRSRDNEILNTCDIVVDVGGVFNPELNKFDHHQRTFNETFENLKPGKSWNIKLSSAGLIYVYFGEEIIKELCKNYDSEIDISIIYEKMYENFLIEIDAIDNGIPVCENEPLYRISSGLSSRVGYLNPWWNDGIDENKQFQKAMDLVGSEFLEKLNFYAKCWWPARKLVQKAIESRYEIHESGSILKLEQGGCPWKSHFFDLEKSMLNSTLDHCDYMPKLNTETKINTPYKIMFVLYSDKSMWRVQCIPVSENQCFQNRCGLLESWRGLRDSTLCKLSGIENCIFVHASGFIGGNATYEGALAMAVKTLESSQTPY